MAVVIMSTVLQAPNRIWNPGDEYECGDAEAERFVALGWGTLKETKPKGRPRKTTAKSE